MDYYIAFFPDGSSESVDATKGTKASWYVLDLILHSTKPSPKSGIQWFRWEGNGWIDLYPDAVPNEIRARVLLQAYER